MYKTRQNPPCMYSQGHWWSVLARQPKQRLRRRQEDKYAHEGIPVTVAEADSKTQNKPRLQGHRRDNAGKPEASKQQSLRGVVLIRTTAHTHTNAIHVGELGLVMGRITTNSMLGHNSVSATHFALGLRSLNGSIRVVGCRRW